MMNLENTVQIETKLEKETKDIAHLKGRVEKYHDLTKSMSSILNSFEHRLGKLEETIVPVYNQTEQLQKRQLNLDSTLQSLETVLSHYDASQEVCNLIHLGPSEGNITTFLESLNKLQRAKDYFFANNSQSMELNNVTGLFNFGCESLCNHFKFLLKKYSTPLRPVEMLDLIYTEDDSSNEDCPSIKNLPPTTREELNTIAAWLDNNLCYQYMNIFADERSDVIHRSLTMLKDHQKSGSWGSEQLKPTRYYRVETPSSKKTTTTTRLQQLFERKANRMFQKASQTIEQSTGFSIKKNSSYGDNLAAEEYAVDSDQEMEKYLVLLLGLQRLLAWERTLLNDVIPPSKQTEVFSRLAQASIEMIVKDAELITSRVMRNIARKEWSSALGVFSALKHVSLLQPDIDKTFDKNQKNQFSMVLQRLQQTGLRALEQFIELVKGETGTNLVGMGTGTLGGYSNSTIPRDATVHELTSNAIWFIEHLFDHYDIIGSILITDHSYLAQVDKFSLSNEDRNKALLGIYIKKVLAELSLTIVSKCEQYSDTATKCLFRLNNVHHILKSLQRSNLIDLVAMTEPAVERSYQDSIQDIKKSYQRTWVRLTSYISPLDELPRPVNGKVKDKERAIIKDRFSNFNKEFDEACKIQRAISVPDVILREGLKRDIAELVIPVYNAFYDKYVDVHFSKSPDKYIRYKSDDVALMLGNLFDDSF